MRRIMILLSLLLSLFILGCINYDETLTLKPNGSGELHFKFGVDESLLGLNDSDAVFVVDESDMRKKLEGIDGVELVDSKTFSDQGSRWTEVILRFNSLANLAQVTQKIEQSDFIGTIALSTDKDGNQHFTRKIISNDSKQTENEIPSKILDSMMGKYSWTYKTKFPGKVISANTADENIDRNNNTVTWKFSFGSILQGPLVMEATIAPSGNGTIWIIAFGIILVVGLITVVIRRMFITKS